MGFLYIINFLHCSHSTQCTTINKPQQHQEIPKNREHWESNPGQLGEKHDWYPLCYELFPLSCGINSVANLPGLDSLNGVHTMMNCVVNVWLGDIRPFNHLNGWFVLKVDPFWVITGWARQRKDSINFLSVPLLYLDKLASKANGEETGNH